MATTSKLERDRQKLVQDKCQQILADLLKDEDNKYCVDCDSKGPRWASWNLGIFLCIRCAGLHRNLGVHISKVKSVNLDSWTPEQIGSIQNMGNSKARAVYEANLPDNFSRPQTNTALEKFIRAKYELKKYIAKEWVNTPPKPAFDIETELKKEKEKKRSKIKPIASISTNEIQSTPLPRPNVNGKTEKASKADDLLGLDLSGGNTPSNDEFGFFASADTSTTSAAAAAAPVATVTGGGLIDTTVSTAGGEAKAPEPANLDKEEHDFFNQKVPDPVEKSKMTKESILSLYAQAPAPSAFMPGPGGVGVAAAAGGGNQFNALGGNAFAPSNVMASTNPFLASNAATAGAAPLFGDLTLPTQPSASVNHIAQGITSLQLDTRNTQSSELFDGLVSNAVRNSFDSFMLSSRPPPAATGAMPAATNTANPFLGGGGVGDLSGLSMFAATSNTNTSSLNNLSFDAFPGLPSGTPSSLLTSTAPPKPEATGNNNLTNLW